jgi:hypothetical protein
MHLQYLRLVTHSLPTHPAGRDVYLCFPACPFYKSHAEEEAPGLCAALVVCYASADRFFLLPLRLCFMQAEEEAKKRAEEAAALRAALEAGEKLEPAACNTPY